MKHLLTVVLGIGFSMHVSAQEADPRVGVPTDNCDTEITSPHLPATCKPPVSVQPRTNEDGEDSTDDVDCIVTAQGARICKSRAA